MQWFESNVATLGLCTGSLSAAVVSGSNSLQSFLTNAARAVAVATRLGFLTDRVSHELEVESAVQKPWAFLIPGVSVDDVVQKINDFVSAKVTILRVHRDLTHADHSRLFHCYLAHISPHTHQMASLSVGPRIHLMIFARMYQFSTAEAGISAYVQPIMLHISTRRPILTGYLLQEAMNLGALVQPRFLLFPR